MNKGRIDASWTDYDKSVIAWNENINGYITKLRQFFSKRLQYGLDINIVPEFQEIGQLLEQVKRQFDNSEADEDYFARLGLISSRLERFSGLSNEYVGSLWSHIDAFKDTIDGSPRVTEENFKELSIWYIAKHIFVFRPQT